ncbi:hypothetical protein GGI1_24956 [Acidithiobacillus sp. GGI-221]|nr:hypothetical protein GGI1_24956 [Acidithiobacillus sp. GGI-221]
MVLIEDQARYLNSPTPKTKTDVLFNDHAISRSPSWLKRYHVQ